MKRFSYGRKRRWMRSRLVLTLVVLSLVTIALFWWWHSHKTPEIVSGSTSQTQSSNKSPGATNGFNKSQHSINNPNSLWVIVNKGRILPSNYVPADLAIPSTPVRPIATSDERRISGQMTAALEQLVNEGKQAGYGIMLASGYRSYATQQRVYNNFVAQLGKKDADRSSARPGHSEHQTGLAVDLEPTSRKCEIQQCFGNTAEGQWLAANAYRFGFIIRYPSGKESLTGYEYEPWHVRYVGTALAQQIHQSSQTLEQFFGLPTYSNYPSQIYRLSTDH